MIKEMGMTLREFLSDVDGGLSSKRLIATIAFLLCAMGFIANMFWGRTVSEFMYDAMMYIVMAGIGGAALEKFTPRGK